MQAIAARCIPLSLSSGDSRRFTFQKLTQHRDADTPSDLRDRIPTEQTVPCQQKALNTEMLIRCQTFVIAFRVSKISVTFTPDTT
jgi:hypothetical protein